MAALGSAGVTGNLFPQVVPWRMHTRLDRDVAKVDDDQISIVLVDPHQLPGFESSDCQASRYARKGSTGHPEMPGF